jgi:Ca2+/Na+ antiporter
MKNKVASLNLILMLLFLISCALFLIFTFRNKETFENNLQFTTGGAGICSSNTNTELQNKNSDFNLQGHYRYPKSEYNAATRMANTNKYSAYCDIENYSDILAYKCLKISPANLSYTMRSSNIKYIFDTIYIFDENTLYSYLKSKIEPLKPYASKIKGPVYVCMSQAPYFKYEKNSVENPINKFFDARSDIINTQKPYNYVSFDEQNKEIAETNTSGSSDISDKISSLYCQILIMFPMYEHNEDDKNAMKLKSSTATAASTAEGDEAIIKTFLETTMNGYYTHNSMCFIKCNKASNLNCGCLNMTEYSSRTDTNTRSLGSSNPPYVIDANKDLPRYTAKCLDHTENDAVADFSLMYFVNPLSIGYQNIIE